MTCDHPVIDLPYTTQGEETLWVCTDCRRLVRTEPGHKHAGVRLPGCSCSTHAHPGSEAIYVHEAGTIDRVVTYP